MCNVLNSTEEFKFPFAETLFQIVLVVNHLIAIYTVNKDFLKIGEKDRPYKRVKPKEKKEGEEVSKAFDMGDFLEQQRRSYAK